MHKTALEMYRDAYELHYIVGDTEKAKKIYNEIIEGYPVSDAADYASIQLKSIEIPLESISSNDRVQVKESSPIAIVVSILTLVITIVIFVFGFLHIKNTEFELKNMSDLSLAQNKIMIKNYDEALLILSELKIKNEKNILPFILASDIYADRKDFKKAKHELQTFKRLNPANTEIGIYLKRLEDKESLFLAKLKEKEKLKSKKKSNTRYIRSKKVKESEPKVRKIKKEEISYF